MRIPREFIKDEDTFIFIGNEFLISVSHKYSNVEASELQVKIYK